MSVTSDLNKIIYVTNGNASYAVPFIFMEKKDLRVFLNNVELVLNQDYSVSGESSNEGGSITFLVEPFSNEADLVILREVSLTQENSFPENGPFLASTIEKMFDRIYFCFQQLKEVSERSIRFPVSSAKYPTVSDIVDPGRVLVVNEDASGLTMGPILADFEISLSNKQSAAEAAQLASEQARDLSVTAKENSQTIKDETLTIKGETQTIKEETQLIKESIEPIASGYPQARTEITNLQSVLGVDENATTLTGDSSPMHFVGDNETVYGAIGTLDARAETDRVNINLLDGRVETLENDHVSLTEVQEVSNKTLKNSVIENTVKLVSKKDTYANLESYATTAEEGEEVFAVDLKKKYFVADGALKQAGGGGNGSLGSIAQFTGEDLRNWTVNVVDFELNKSTPMYGEASYKMTLKSTVGSVISPLIPVTKSLLNTPLALLVDYLYNGSNGDVILKVLDQDNVELSQFNLESAITTKTAKQFINIPSGVSGIKFKFDNIVINDGKVFEFDKLELTTDLLSKVSVDQSQSAYLYSNNNFTNSNITGVLTNIKGSGIFTYNSATGEYKVVRRASVRINASVRSNSGSFAIAAIYMNDEIVSKFSTLNSNGYHSTASFSGILDIGDTLYVKNTTGNPMNEAYVSILATASNPEILSPVNQISSDNLNWQFKAGAIVDSDPIGTFNTSVYAGGGNTRTLATTPPTQSYESMRQNGLQLFVRAYNAASTAAQPVRFDVKIGRDLIGPSRNFIKLFKNTGKSIEGNTEIVRFPTDSTTREGFEVIGYDQNTGILTIDAGYSISSAVTAPRLLFSDGTTQTNGFVTFTASKAPVIATIPMAARYIVKTYTNGTDSYEIYNDGWVVQRGLLPTTPTSSIKTFTYLVSFRDNDYNLMSSVTSSYTPTVTLNWNIVNTNSQSTNNFTAYSDINLAKSWEAKGYGDSSAVRALGATPNY